jgi:hypothetical protein
MVGLDRDGIRDVSVAIDMHNILGNWAVAMKIPFTLGSLWMHV